MAEITKSFKTSGGHTINVIGKFIEQEEYTYPSLGLTEMQDVFKVELEIVVEGHGSQGGNIKPYRFSKNGINYTHIVGKLPLTVDQMAIVDSVRSEIEAIKNNNPVIIAIREQNVRDKAEFGEIGTYEDVQHIHSSWME